jgi:hypothetical protein
MHFRGILLQVHGSINLKKQAALPALRVSVFVPLADAGELVTSDHAMGGMRLVAL